MAARKTTQPLNDGQLMIVETLRSKPAGMTATELAAVLGTTQRRMSLRLYNLQQRGEVALAGWRNCYAWCVPAHKRTAEAASKARAEASAKAKAEAARLAAAGAQRSSDPDEPPDDPLLFKRPAIVPASTAPRIETRGVPSVFDLAHYA